MPRAEQHVGRDSISSLMLTSHKVVGEGEGLPLAPLEA